MSLKSKNILLIAGFIILVVVCYNMAISNTVSLHKEYTQLKHQKLLHRDAPKQLSLLLKKQSYYDSILNKHQFKGHSVQNNLLESITAFSKKHHLKITQFLEPHLFIENNLSTKTYQLQVEGSYNNIIRLIHKLEQNTKFGEVMNVHFEKIKNHRTRKFYLRTKILLKKKFR